MKNLIQSILILIAVFMSTTGAEEVKYVQVGETVTLPQPRITMKNYYVYWYFGKESGLQLAWLNHFGGKRISDGLRDLWKDRLSLSDNSLIIRNIQQENFGTFVCKVTEESKGLTTTIITYKVLKLNVSLNPASPLLPGESLTLTCDAETPQGLKPQIYWLDPQGMRNRGASGGKLTLSATSQHNGKWTCVVTNNKKESKTTISVTVIDLSPAPSHRQYTSKSLPLTIPCSLLPHISWEQIKAKGIRRVEWHFSPKPSSSLKAPQILFSLSLKNLQKWEVHEDRKLRSAPNLDKGNLSLSRPRATEEDGGDYVCSLEFNNSVTLYRTIHVEVLEITSLGTEYISGQRVNLTCSTGHALPPDLRLKWIPPQSSYLQSLGSDHHPSHLIIPEVGRGDGGMWRCELWQNNTRLTSAMIMLKIEPKLSVWMLVIICGAAVIVILICILVLILYQRRQRKMRRLRHRVCQCKNPKPKGFYRT